MRISCEKCTLDQDGRCQECITLVGLYMSTIAKIQDEFTETLQLAQLQMEDEVGELKKEFKGKAHQCEECLNTNADYAMAQLVRRLSADPVMSPSVTEALYERLKASLVPRGITKTPLLDKAWSDVRKS